MVFPSSQKDAANTTLGTARSTGFPPDEAIFDGCRGLIQTSRCYEQYTPKPSEVQLSLIFPGLLLSWFPYHVFDD
jgi:hypothetical protein